MIFQGDVNDIDRQSSTGVLVNNGNENQMLAQMHDDSGLAGRVMQELHINEQRNGYPRENGSAGRLQPDQSSSRLTDMLHGVSPRRDESNGDFRRNCPSAVPSPLHKVPGARTPVQPSAPVLDSAGPPISPFVPPKSIDDHFFMTNEHMDVVGKSLWDQGETLRKEILVTANHRQAKLVSTIEKHVDDIKMQVDSVNEKADRTTEQGHNIHTKLEELFDFIKGDVMGALHIQDTKAAELELNVKELQKTVQNMHKTLEQKQFESKASQQHVTAASTSTQLPVDRSQASLGGYYGNMTESGREGQPAMPHIPDHRNGGLAQESHNGTRGGYGNYGQQWAPRAGYSGHGNKEERGYTATNPYNFANGTVNGSQYSNGYNGGYPYN